MKNITRHLVSMSSLPLLALGLSACAGPKKAPESCCASGAKVSRTSKPYTNKVCLVSREELGSMGETITEVYNGQEVKFCCKSCVKKFHANPEKYMSRINR